MKSGQVYSRLGNQGGQLGNKTQRFEYDMEGAIAVRHFSRVRDHTLGAYVLFGTMAGMVGHSG
jgi:hypothetical protein